MTIRFQNALFGFFLICELLVTDLLNLLFLTSDFILITSEIHVQIQPS